MELLLVGLNFHLFCTLFLAVLCIYTVRKGLLVSSFTVNLAKAGLERLAGAFVSLREAPMLCVSQRVTAVVGKRLPDTIFCLATRRTSTHVTLTISGHGANETSSLRVLHVHTVRGGVRPRRLVWHLELATFRVQVEDSHLLVRTLIGKVRAII